MWTTMRALLVAVGLLLGSAVVAAAADFCILFNGGANTIVLKTFTLPVKGTCKDTRGFTPPGNPFWIKGTACGSSDGADITFFSTSLSSDGSFYATDFFKLQRSAPTIASIGKHCLVDNGGSDPGFCFSAPYAKTTCGALTVPVPN